MAESLLNECQSWGTGFSRSQGSPVPTGRGSRVLRSNLGQLGEETEWWLFVYADSFGLFKIVRNDGEREELTTKAVSVKAHLLKPGLGIQKDSGARFAASVRLWVVSRRVVSLAPRSSGWQQRRSGISRAFWTGTRRAGGELDISLATWGCSC